MICKTTNTFRSARRVSPDCASVDGKYLMPSSIPLFRQLWRRRGSWSSFERLVLEIAPHSRTAFDAALRALRDRLPRDFRIEHRTETILRGVNGEPDVRKEQYRLTTSETLPEPIRPDPELISLDEMMERELA